MASLFTSADTMRLNLVLNFLYIVIVFGLVIEARWSRTLPSSGKKKILKIFMSRIKTKSQAFQTLPKESRKKSDKETMEKYCRFLLGAYKECMAKYLGFKLIKVQKNEEKQHRRQNTSTTVSPTSTTLSPLIRKNEKIYVRI